jgi:integrase
VPGEFPINPLQITRRWRNQVKAEPSKDGKSGGIGIKADFYSLKHSHSTEVVDLLSTHEAAQHNSHADDSMVTKVYDIRRADRQHDRIKKLNNPL